MYFFILSVLIVYVNLIQSCEEMKSGAIFFVSRHLLL
jgi:hypothetical protein